MVSIVPAHHRLIECRFPSNADIRCCHCVSVRKVATASTLFLACPHQLLSNLSRSSLRHSLGSYVPCVLVESAFQSHVIATKFPYEPQHAVVLHSACALEWYRDLDHTHLREFYRLVRFLGSRPEALNSHLLTNLARPRVDQPLPMADRDCVRHHRIPLTISMELRSNLRRSRTRRD